MTGYDFAELIEDHGRLLEVQLGVTNQVHRHKIVKNMKLLMSGASTAPGEPQMFTAAVEECDIVVLRWAKPETKGWPVHKFRVLRKVARTSRGGGSAGGGGAYPLLSRFTPYPVFTPTDEPPCAGYDNESCPGGAGKGDGGEEIPDRETAEGWVVLYEGMATLAEDQTAAEGVQYEYKIEAWSLFGRADTSLRHTRERDGSCAAGSGLWQMVRDAVVLHAVVVSCVCAAQPL